MVEEEQQRHVLTAVLGGVHGEFVDDEDGGVPLAPGNAPAVQQVRREVTGGRDVRLPGGDGEQDLVTAVREQW
ncbi:hypothetical protein TNCT6_73350 [Streptomyces sp. 6-11-2]|nr:hypothetical protein TNCT6_73350 [Streptomyces sp. 6-11-2]